MTITEKLEQCHANGKGFCDLTQEERLQLFDEERRRLDPYVNHYREMMANTKDMNDKERRDYINNIRAGKFLHKD